MRDTRWERGKERERIERRKEGGRFQCWRVWPFLPSRVTQGPSSWWRSLGSFAHQRSLHTELLSAGPEDGGTDVDGVCAGYSALSGKKNLFIDAVD